MQCGFYHHRKKQQEREKGAEYPLGPNVSLDAQEKEKDNLPGKLFVVNKFMS